MAVEKSFVGRQAAIANPIKLTNTSRRLKAIVSVGHCEAIFLKASQGFLAQ
jgi:hypothetical protein